MRSFSRDGRRDRIITPNANSHDEPPAKDPGHLEIGSRYTVWQSDDHDGAKNAYYELIAVNKAAAENVAKIAEAELTDDVPHICGAVDKTTE